MVNGFEFCNLLVKGYKNYFNICVKCLDDILDYTPFVILYDKSYGYANIVSKIEFKIMKSDFTKISMSNISKIRLDKIEFSNNIIFKNMDKEV